MGFAVFLNNTMGQGKQKICVYYDGACPQCIKYRKNYEKHTAETGGNVVWIDIIGNEQLLQALNNVMSLLSVENHRESRIYRCMIDRFL